MSAVRAETPVDLYDDDGGEPYARAVPLAEAFPEPDDLAEAVLLLTPNGQAWFGGGAGRPVFVSVTPVEGREP